MAQGSDWPSVRRWQVVALLVPWKDYRRAHWALEPEPVCRDSFFLASLSNNKKEAHNNHKETRTTSKRCKTTTKRHGKMITGTQKWPQSDEKQTQIGGKTTKINCIVSLTVWCLAIAWLGWGGPCLVCPWLCGLFGVTISSYWFHVRISKCFFWHAVITSHPKVRLSPDWGGGSPGIPYMLLPQLPDMLGFYAYINILCAQYWRLYGTPSLCAPCLAGAHGFRSSNADNDACGRWSEKRSLSHKTSYRRRTVNAADSLGILLLHRLRFSSRVASAWRAR